MIPVLSIHQPYASLIPSGVKRWETRSWPYPARKGRQGIWRWDGTRRPT